MSVASPPAPAASDASPPVEGCPLCGFPLRPEQDWCLSCGAAARTRLAAAPGWRAPLIGLGLVIVLALGALTAALVELAGAPPASTPVTRTVTAPGAAAPGFTAPTATTPGATLPSTTLPTTPNPPLTTTTATSTSSSVPPTTLPGANVPRTTVPRVGTTPKR